VVAPMVAAAAMLVAAAELPGMVDAVEAAVVAGLTPNSPISTLMPEV
jgi:hypothetical protein